MVAGQMKPVYLLTGRPGSGKTSLVKQVVARIPGQAGGFYTEEIRTQGMREGFRLVTLDGETVILAHIKIHSPHRVGKYGVDVEALARVGVPALERAAQHGDLVVIDEIGRMELFSPRFREVVSQVITSGKKVLSTIMLNPNPFADAIKRQPNVNLIMIDRENYELVLAELIRWVEL
jgi:nucleoside-triphosphatase